MNREELQDTGLFLLERTKRLMCQWATGTGKSNVAVKFMKKHPDVKCLIVVPEQDNIQNWLNEFAKFKVPADNVTVTCYASFKKYENTSWGLLVFDEAPHADTEKRKAIAATVKAEYVLALGAKIDEEEEQALKDNYGEFYKTTVLLEDAVRWGILPKPTVVICHMQLNDTDRAYQYNGHKFTAKELYDYHAKTVEACVNQYNEKPNAVTRQRMFQAGIKRKRMLGSMKEKAIREICARLNEKNRRFLCFCSSVKQAEAIGGKNAFTSKTPKSMKLLDKFNNHEINSLYVVGKLIEGQNLTDIECGVIGQLGGTERIAIQSIGRIMRSDSPLIYIPVFDDTKDDAFLFSIRDNISKDCIRHYKFNL